MKKASNVRLSLRKLFIAMMAVGPIAVLPSPLLAAVPADPFAVASGTATWSGAGTGVGTVQQTSNRAVLLWKDNLFNIAEGDTFNFFIPSDGAVLNKVGYNTSTGALAAVDDAIINGTLFATGRVYVIANGNIQIGGNATITTIGGLSLSTLEEVSDFSFNTSGNLALTGNSTGSITIGNATHTPSISGNLEVTAGSIASHGGTVTGDLILRSVTADTALNLAQSEALDVTGNLTAITRNGTISSTELVKVGSATGNQTTTLSTGATGNTAINLNNVANDFEVVAITAPGADGDVTLNDANNIILSNSTIGGDLAVTAVGAANANAIATNGTLTVAGTAAFTSSTSNSAINIGHNSTITGVVTATADNSTITVNTAGNLQTGAINAGTGSRAGISLTSQNGTLTLGGALTVVGSGTGSTNITLTGRSITQTGAISLTAATGSVVSYNATAGSISIGAVTAPRISANSSTTGGAIGQSAAITTTNGTATSSFNAGTGSVTLANPANAFAAGQVLQFTGSSVALTNTLDTVLGTTNTTGALTLNVSGGSDLVLGTGAGTAAQNIRVGGILNATTANGNITDSDQSQFNVFGGLNLITAGGDVELDAASANGSLAPSVQLGRVDINAGAGDIVIAESTGLNLGTITGATLDARSTGGPIIDSGVINLATSATFTVPADQSVVIDNPGHALPLLNVVGGNDNSILVGSATTIGNNTSVTGNLTVSSTAGVGITVGQNFADGTVGVVGNFTVNSGGTIIVNGPTTVSGNLSLTAGDASATSIFDDNLGALSVTGTTTVASSGGVVLDGANDFGTLMFNGITGASTFSDINNLTVSGNATGAMTVTAGGTGGVPGPWALSLGNMNVGSLIATAGNGGGGNSSTITQLADTALHVENTASFKTTNANIVIGNNGNSFGRVAIDAGSGAVTLVEDGTLKLGNLVGKGSSSITSRFGSIIEDSTADNSISNDGTLTLNAVNGSITIGNTTHTAGVTVGNLTAVVLNAPNGAASIITNNTVSLGSTNVNSLAVTATNNITQSAGVKVFGSATFNSTAGNIVLSNSTNNFGRLSLTVGGAARNITITEGGTLNLGTVSMPANSSGNFTATSVNGDIVDNGFGGVKFGGTIVGQTANVGTGIVTLAASNGNIVLDDLTTEFVTNGGVVFNAQNVTLKPLGQSTIYLGAAGTSSVAGNLTVQSSVGSIANNGDLNISGNASFETGTGNISVTSAGNRFGTVQFVGNQISISQVNDMNIVRGSQAIGQAQLASTGSYITIAEGTGVVSFGNTVSMVASGNITLPDALQAVGQLSVNASGTKDLSALSVSGDLNGQAPINLGTGAYVPPQN